MPDNTVEGKVVIETFIIWYAILSERKMKEKYNP